MENQVYAALANIFKTRFPKTATSFHTGDGMACFLLGRGGKWSYRKMSKKQVAELKHRGLHGSFGWALQ